MSLRKTYFIAIDITLAGAHKMTTSPQRRPGKWRRNMAAVEWSASTMQEAGTSQNMTAMVT